MASPSVRPTASSSPTLSAPDRRTAGPPDRRTAGPPDREVHADQAREGDDEPHDGPAFGQRAAQVGAEREETGGDRDVTHRLAEQGVAAVPVHRPEAAEAQRVAHGLNSASGDPGCLRQNGQHGGRLRRLPEQALDLAELFAQAGDVGLGGTLLVLLEAQHELPAWLEDPVLDVADVVPVLHADPIVDFAAAQPQVDRKSVAYGKRVEL